VEAFRLTVECALRQDGIALHCQQSCDRRAFHRTASGGENHQDHQQGVSGSSSHRHSMC
jgi:hypothetical protein